MNATYRESALTELGPSRAGTEIYCAECGRRRRAARAGLDLCAECVGRAFEIVAHAWPLADGAGRAAERTTQTDPVGRRIAIAMSVVSVFAVALFAVNIAAAAACIAFLRRPTIALGPRALATLASAHHAPRRVPRAAAAASGAGFAPRDAPVPAVAPPSLLAETLPLTHDPAALLARARQLNTAGVDVTIATTTLSKHAFDRIVDNTLGLSPNDRAVPVRRADRVVAFRLVRVANDSPLALIGLREGDTVLSVNGHDLQGTEALMRERPTSLVTELWRAGHRVVLALRLRG